MTKTAVGMVDPRGLGVPFILCTPYVNPIATAEGIITDAANAKIRFLILVARYSHPRMMKPPNRNV